MKKRIFLTEYLNPISMRLSKMTKFKSSEGFYQHVETLEFSYRHKGGKGWKQMSERVNKEVSTNKECAFLFPRKIKRV